MKTGKRLLCALLAFAMLILLSSCGLLDSSTAVQTTKKTTEPSKPYVDADVSDVLRNFYQNELRSSVIRSGVKDANGEEIRCDISMLQKTIFEDFDDDGSKEIVLLYDVSGKDGEHSRNVVVFIDEQDAKPYIASIDTGSFGASKENETSILTRYNSRVCKVRFIYKDAYQAVLIDEFEDGAWQTVLTAYRHISDHDGVKLENDSCYIDHAGGDLYEAVRGKAFYSKEKFLNFRTPIDNYNSLVTTLLSETMLP
ncbi:MAG: hypothetical protein IJT44_11270 [Clostridia bacterium]|nr:hypothetical protein [Clostridia bacterium]